MSAVPVLFITHDDAVWQHWRQIDTDAWLPARGKSLDDLDRWVAQGRVLAVLDGGLPRLPEWEDATWGQCLRSAVLVVASMRPNDEEGKRVLAAGAKGYCHVYTPAVSWSVVLNAVNAGSVWLGPTLLARLLRQIDNALARDAHWAQGLTAREVEVAQRAAIGHSNQAIADALNISERTVRAHLSAVFEKLAVADRLALALKVHGIQ